MSPNQKVMNLTTASLLLFVNTSDESRTHLDELQVSPNLKYIYISEISPPIVKKVSVDIIPI